MKQFPFNYLVIPGIAILAMVLGRFFSAQGMAWYTTLQLPAITPPQWVFPVVWTIIYILTTISVLIVWNTVERTSTFWVIIGLFLINLFFNIFWSYLFFTNHMIGAALIDAILIEVSLFLLIVCIFPVAQLAALLLLPYVVWVFFAIILNVLIWQIN